MANKTAYTHEVIRVTKLLAEAADLADDLVKEWADNGYAVSGGANQIVDADLSDFNVTAAELGSGITLLEQFGKFAGNDGTQVTADYKSTMNKLRRAY